jgi:hypothetical protein
MPLNTQIRRDGKPLSVRWGGFHVACMVLAAAWDSGEGKLAEQVSVPEDIDYPNEPCRIGQGDVWDLMSYPVIALTPLNSGPYTLKGTHRFEDAADGEVLELLPGDVLSAWRD